MNCSLLNIFTSNLQRIENPRQKSSNALSYQQGLRNWFFRNAVIRLHRSVSREGKQVGVTLSSETFLLLFFLIALKQQQWSKTESTTKTRIGAIPQLQQQDEQQDQVLFGPHYKTVIVIMTPWIEHYVQGVITAITVNSCFSTQVEVHYENY